MGSLFRPGRALPAILALGCPLAAGPGSSADPDRAACAALRPALSEVRAGLRAVQDPDAGDTDLQSPDPQQRASKTQEFVGHLRLAAVLAHDTAGKLEDPGQADAVERFATALDAYLRSLDPDEQPGGTKPADAASELKPASEDFAELVRSSCRI